MKYIKLSDFEKIDKRPFLLGAFLSLTKEIVIDGNKFFYACSRFKASKFVFKDEFSFEEYSEKYIQQLNAFSGWENWVISTVSETNLEARFYILDDINMPKELFYKLIYSSIHSSSWIFENGLTMKKKDFLRGFAELRGSVDTKLKYLAEDYFYDNKMELKKALILIDSIDLPMGYVNFNFREFQNDYITGKRKRNTQFRINLFWYVTRIGFINDYKALIFEKVYTYDKKYNNDGITYYERFVPDPKKDDANFIQKLNIYTNSIYNRYLTPELIKEMRKELHFDSDNEQSKINRNTTLVNLFKKIEPNKCAICGTTKTFKNKGTGEDYFEIHHMIPFHNGKELDNIANFVKLCPTCHSSLKKGRASKQQQIDSISFILSNKEVVYEFCSNHLELTDIREMAIKIQTMLG